MYPHFDYDAPIATGRPVSGLHGASTVLVVQGERIEMPTKFPRKARCTDCGWAVAWIVLQIAWVSLGGIWVWNEAFRSKVPPSAGGMVLEDLPKATVGARGNHAMPGETASDELQSVLLTSSHTESSPGKNPVLLTSHISPGQGKSSSTNLPPVPADHDSAFKKIQIQPEPETELTETSTASGAQVSNAQTDENYVEDEDGQEYSLYPRLEEDTSLAVANEPLEEKSGRNSSGRDESSRSAGKRTSFNHDSTATMKKVAPTALGSTVNNSLRSDPTRTKNEQETHTFAALFVSAIFRPWRNYAFIVTCFLMTVLLMGMLVKMLKNCTETLVYGTIYGGPIFFILTSLAALSGLTFVPASTSKYVESGYSMAGSRFALASQFENLDTLRDLMLIQIPLYTVLILSAGGFISSMLWSFCVCCCYHRFLPLTIALMKSTAEIFDYHCGGLSISLLGCMTAFLYVPIWLCGTGALYSFLVDDDHKRHVVVTENGREAYYLVSSQDGGKSDSSTGLWIAFVTLSLLTLYWTEGVLRNALHTTFCKFAGMWYFNADAAADVQVSLEPRPTLLPLSTWRCWFSSWTTHLGSICLGSFLVAVIQVVQVLISLAEDNQRRTAERDGVGPRCIIRIIVVCILSVLRCLLHAVEQMLEFFNSIAYCHVAVYNQDFVTSVKSTWNLLTKSGVRVLINSNNMASILNVVWLAFVILAALCQCVVGFVIFSSMKWSGSDWDDPRVQAQFQALIVLYIWQLFISLANLQTACSMLSSGTLALLVCWAEHPDTLAKTHPELALDLSRALRDAHSNIMYSQDPEALQPTADMFRSNRGPAAL